MNTKLPISQMGPKGSQMVKNNWVDHKSKKFIVAFFGVFWIYRPKMIVDVRCYVHLRWSCFLFWGVSLHVCAGWDPSMWQLFVERFWVICVCLHHLVVLGLLLLQWIQWGPNLAHEEINSLTTPGCNQRHPVEVYTAQWKSTTTNLNLSKPYNFKTHASRTKRKNQYGQWATDTVGEKLMALNNGHSHKRKHIQNIFHICHRSWWERDTVLQKQKKHLAPSSKTLIDCPAELHSNVRVGILFSGKNFGEQSNFGISS